MVHELHRGISHAKCFPNCYSDCSICKCVANVEEKWFLDESALVLTALYVDKFDKFFSIRFLIYEMLATIERKKYVFPLGSRG